MGTKLLLDGSSIRSEADFHDVIDQAAQAIGFDGYGRNLDALWDVLTGILRKPVEVRWLDASASRAALGPRFDRIVDTFEEAKQELGPDFSFEMQQ